MCEPQGPDERKSWLEHGWRICEGMFLGGSLVTSEDRLIACAPRWGSLPPKNPNGVRVGGTEGACFWMNLADITDSEARIFATDWRRQLLAPLKYGEDLRNKSGMPSNMNFLDEFGFSAHFSSGKRKLIFGAVGVGGEIGLGLSPLLN